MFRLLLPFYFYFRAPGLKLDPDEFIANMSDPAMPEKPEKLKKGLFIKIVFKKLNYRCHF